MFFSDTIIDTAYKWLWKRRKDYYHNSDVWHLRFYWKTEKEKLIKELKEETFSFDCVDKIRTPDRIAYLWSARDALVLKALSIYLEDKLKPILSDRIFHRTFFAPFDRKLFTTHHLRWWFLHDNLKRHFPWLSAFSITRCLIFKTLRWRNGENRVILYTLSLVSGYSLNKINLL